MSGNMWSTQHSVGDDIEHRGRRGFFYVELVSVHPVAVPWGSADNLDSDILIIAVWRGVTAEEALS